MLFTCLNHLFCFESLINSSWAILFIVRETIEMYAEAIHELAIDLGRMLAKSMGLASDLFKGWPCQFRINKYNFTPETVGSSGVQIHTDSGFLTILQDDENVGGLEVMDKSGAFVSVDPWVGTLLVNLGDVAKVCKMHICRGSHFIIILYDFIFYFELIN